MKKSIISLLIALILVLMFSACNTEAEEEAAPPAFPSELQGKWLINGTAGYGEVKEYNIFSRAFRVDIDTTSPPVDPKPPAQNPLWHYIVYIEALPHTRQYGYAWKVVTIPYDTGNNMSTVFNVNGSTLRVGKHVYTYNGVPQDL